MCGITGFVQADLRGAEHIIKQMSDAIAHRGPDDSGQWIDPDSGVVLGFRRLAILDLSQAGHQPMLSPSGRFAMVYNGEVYNYLEFRDELVAKGEKFKGHSDTEAMLAAFEEWGVEPAVKRFNGMFAFALWDRRERMLHLCRDRLGEKPLYYGWSKGAFVFGSELRAITKHPTFEKTINRNSLSLLVRHCYIPAPYSIFENIWKLGPGTILSLSLDRLRMARDFSPYPDAATAFHPRVYWDAKTVFDVGAAAPFRSSQTEAVEALEQLLSDSVKSRMISDVPLGAFLSGGIDSSTVVALMQKHSTKPVKTFTIGFNEAGFNEAQHASTIAKHLGTEHTELYLSPKETLQVVPNLPAIFDEPFADSSQIPTYLVSKLARTKVTVSLSGDGGDELFAGYERYRSGPNLWRKLQALPLPLRKLLSSITGILGALGPISYQKKVDYLRRVLPAQDFVELNNTIHSFWERPEEVVIGANQQSTCFSNRDRWPKVESLVSAMQFCDTVAYLPDDILAKVDRASMAVSLESRVPLLNHKVVEFAASVPIEFKVRAGQSKWILRQVLERYVPRSMFDRPKMGFAVPIDQWLRTDLRDWADDLLGEQKLRSNGYFVPEPIIRKWQEHRSGKANWQYQLWSVLMFQAWHAANVLTSSSD
jgi:asparagine synthase (glutamine-hydrolysing)